MNETRTMSPASTNNFATSAMRRMFSHPIRLSEPQVAVQPVANVIAIQRHRVMAQSQQMLFHEVGDGGFARSGKPGEPKHRRLLQVQSGARLLIDVQPVPKSHWFPQPGTNVGDHARADSASKSAGRSG